LPLNKNKKLSFHIWARETLRIKIEKQPFLRSEFFGSPALTMFVPAPTYFAEASNDLLEADRSLTNEIKSMKDRIDEYVAFLNNKAKKIFVIHAPGGYGKSHFLRELPVVTKDREVWFVRNGVRDVKQAFADEIAIRETAQQKHRYVIVVDDTDRTSDIKEFVQCILNSGIDIKLVLSSRTSGLSLLDDAIIGTGTKPATDITEIPQWTVEELKTLLRKVSGKDKVKNEDLIVRAYPNPFFIVKIAQAARKSPDFNFELIREIILQSLIRDTKSILSAKQTLMDVNTLLLHLSLTSPLNISDDAMLSKMAQKFNTNPGELKFIINELVQKRVLRRIGGLARFIPDMIGDVFLLQEMQALSPEERRDCFLYWFDTHAKNIFCNLGATLKYGDDAYLKQIISDVISNWTQNSLQYDEYEKKQILDNLQEIGHVAPEKTLNLLHVFLAEGELTADDYGPVITGLMTSNCSRKEIVRLISDLKEKAKKGTYDNYKPHSLIRKSVSPLHNNIERKILPTLEALADSLTKSKEAENADLLKTALEEVLAGSHEFTSSTYKAMEVGSRVLNANEAVIGMRNKAINILKNMLQDSRAQVRRYAIEVIEDIGRMRFGAGSSQIPLQGKIDAENIEMIDFVAQEKLLDQEKDWTVLSAYEDWLFSWWARQEVEDEKILQLLNKFPQDPEYRILRYYVSRWDIDIEGSVIEKLRIAPTKERWNWAVDNIMERKWHLKVEDFQKDAEILNKKYTTPSGIVVFLNNLYEQVSVTSANALFLRAWAKINPTNFKQIREDNKLWTQVPRLFKYTISYDLVHHYPELAQKVIDEILASPMLDIDEARIALDVLSYDVPLSKLDVIKKLAEKNNQDLNMIVVEKLRYIGEKFTPEEMGEALLHVLGKIDSNWHQSLSDHIAFILHNKSSDYKDSLLKIIYDPLYQIILTSKDLDYYDSEIISFIIKDTKMLVDFIEKRLEREKSINKYSEYKAVPHNGITSLPKIIQSKEDFCLAVERAIAWESKYEGIINYSVSEIFEQILSLRDATGKHYAEELKTRFSTAETFPRFLEYLSKLPLNKANLGIFKDAISIGTKLGFDYDIGKLLRSKVYPEDGWTSSGDETPPAFY
jgi:hypothetical protein